MPPGVYIPRFSPESKIECRPDIYREIWQVFWLHPKLIAFPFKQWREN